MQTLPPETLGEIFFHTLPPDTLDHLQPDVKSGPMLLCQVCAHWRLVALSTPLLWETLFHALRVSPALVPSSLLLGGGIDTRDLEFLKWWRANLGGVPPRLRLGVFWMESELTPSPAGKRLDDDGFFLSFIASARYLDLDRGLACMAREYFRCQQTVPQCTSPFKNSTLLIRSASRDFRRITKKFSRDTLYCPASAPFSATPSLSRLFLDSMMIAQRDLPDIGWSNLTHAILVNVLFSNRAWPRAIRQCERLEFGVFHVGGYNEPGEPDEESQVVALSNLRQLVVKWNPLDFGESVFMFRNLTFPHLTALRLESVLSLRALHEILDATPALEELHLSYRIPKDPDEKSKAGWFPGPTSSASIDPLPTHAPLLRRLVLQVNLTWNEGYRDLDHLIDVIMQSPWLGLARGTSRVEEVALTADYSGSREVLMKRFKKPLLRDGVRLTALEDSPWWMDGYLEGQYVTNPFECCRFFEDRGRDS